MSTVLGLGLPMSCRMANVQAMLVRAIDALQSRCGEARIGPLIQHELPLFFNRCGGGKEVLFVRRVVSLGLCPSSSMRGKPSSITGLRESPLRGLIADKAL